MLYRGTQALRREGCTIKRRHGRHRHPDPPRIIRKRQVNLSHDCLMYDARNRERCHRAVCANLRRNADCCMSPSLEQSDTATSPMLRCAFAMAEWNGMHQAVSFATLIRSLCDSAAMILHQPFATILPLRNSAALLHVQCPCQNLHRSLVRH